MLNKIKDWSRSLTGKQPRFYLEITGALATEIVRFKAEENVSKPFEVNVTIATNNGMNFEEVIEKEALLTIKGNEMDRYFHGIVRKFELDGISTSGKYLYKAQIVPYFRLLSLEKDCRIFQDMNIQDIITTIFQESEIEPKFYEFRYVNKDRLRKYCCQINESDQEFIERLLQEEGIFYFFEHYEDRHVMIFGQDQSDYTPPKYNNEIIFMAASGMSETEECINSIDFSKRLTSGIYTHTNYNFKNPAADLEKDHNSKDEKTKKYEVYEYPGLYGDIDRGAQLAQSKLNSHQVFAEQAQGSSDSNRLIPGYTFKLIGHDFESFNKEYIIIENVHNGKQPQTMEEEAQGGTHYSNDFIAIPSNVDYSPKKTLEKPLMRGPQTAIVVGREGDEICTDEFGRIKVQFYWDRKGQNDEGSSCWLRCAQFWSGAGWGVQFTPRVGDEVVVDFLNGDPDYPVIIGCLYNGTNPPPYALPENKTRSTIKTRSTPNSRGFNELSFEDKAGSEEVYLQGEKDWKILIKNDKGQNIGHDETLDVKNDRTKTVGNSQKETIGKDKTIYVTNNHEEEIGANMTLIVKGNKSETVHSDESQTIRGTKTVTISGQMSTICDSSMMEQVSHSKQTMVGTTYTIQADSGIKIICGGTTMDITPSGISVNGSNIALLGKTKIN